MRFSICHHTSYTYSQAVQLTPKLLRFYPRSDGAQRILSYQMSLTPEPQGRSDYLDLEGNTITRVWFAGSTDRFSVDVSMEVETLRKNPYDFLLADAALSLPVDYSGPHAAISCYLPQITADESVTALAEGIRQAAGNDTLKFLHGLSERLFNDITHRQRETGEPQAPAITLEKRIGACRDITVLFMACCQAVGIAVRFVSGYQRGDPTVERRQLHAWPEVYLPGAGWRGFDPTHGTLNADTHVSIAAAADPRNTMPVSGGFFGKAADSRLDYRVRIRILDEAE